MRDSVQIITSFEWFGQQSHKSTYPANFLAVNLQTDNLWLNFEVQLRMWIPTHLVDETDYKNENVERLPMASDYRKTTSVLLNDHMTPLMASVEIQDSLEYGKQQAQ